MTTPVPESTSSEPPRCGNCLTVHTATHNVCILPVLFGILVDARESMTEAEAVARMAAVNVDALWDDLGPILDQLAGGKYDVDGDGRRSAAVGDAQTQ